MSFRNGALTGRKTSNWIKVDDLQVTVPLHQLSHSRSPSKACGAAGLGLRTLLGQDRCICNRSELSRGVWDPGEISPWESHRVSGGATWWVWQSFKNKIIRQTGFQHCPPWVLGPQSGRWAWVKCLSRSGCHPAVGQISSLRDATPTP